MRKLFWEFDEPSRLDIFDNDIFTFRLLVCLLIFGNSADFDGWIRLIKRKEKNINFFDIPEINLRIQLKY